MVISPKRVGLFAAFLGLGLVAVVVVWQRLEIIKPDLEPKAQPAIRVLTYESFVDPSGPGRELAKAFEAECKCRVHWIIPNDAQSVVDRISEEYGKGLDLVVGIDQYDLDKARSVALWRKMEWKKSFFSKTIRDYVESDFTPFDWSPLTLIFKVGSMNHPPFISDLKRPEYRGLMILEDPKTSSLGRQFLMALYQWFNDAEVSTLLSDIRPSVKSVAPSWTLAYGQFQRGEGSLVFSYQTSLVYHWMVEKDGSFGAVSWPEGHPLQVEYAGVIDSCNQCDLAQKFLKAMLSRKGQETIMNRNFMYPARAGLVKGTAFERLSQLVILPRADARAALQRLPSRLETWASAFEGF